MSTDNEPRPDDERLEALGERIEEARERLREDEGEDELRFSDDGTHGPVDDAVAPPG